MLLQRLLEYADRGSDDSPSMYKLTPIRYEAQLDEDGNLLGMVTLSSGVERGRDRGKPMLVPARERSGTAPKPILLADTLEYALGIGRPEKAPVYHQAFVDLLHACLEATGEGDLRTILRFLEQPVEERPGVPTDLEAGAVTFSVAGRWPVDTPSVRAFWAAAADRSAGGVTGAQTQCMVCGEHKPVVDRFPIKIKGVLGTQGSGAALVTANSNAFNSYGLAEAYLAPTCARCAERIGTSLNRLIADPANRIYLSPLTYVFWTREKTDYQWGVMLTQPDSGQVAALLGAAYGGRQAASRLDTNAFYCVALAGNSGRIAVRDWIDTTVSEAQTNLARYFALQQIVDRAGVVERYFGVRALAGATVRDSRKDNPSPGVPRALMRVALQGGPLPDALLAQAIRRVQAGQGVSHAQAALIKMVLAGAIDDPQRLEDFMVKLDESNRDPAYLCGRLLAVLDDIQRAALGQRNATIIDRFFGSASTAPISVFGRLVRGAQPHLAKLRRDRPGTYAALDTRMTGIIGDIGTFPRTLTLRQQGLFVLGYYHQRAADTKARIERAAARRAAGALVDDVELLDDELEG